MAVWRRVHLEGTDVAIDLDRAASLGAVDRHLARRVEHRPADVAEERAALQRRLEREMLALEDVAVQPRPIVGLLHARTVAAAVVAETREP